LEQFLKRDDCAGRGTAEAGEAILMLIQSGSEQRKPRNPYLLLAVIWFSLCAVIFTEGWIK